MNDAEITLELNKKVLRAANNALQVILSEFANETPRSRFLLVSRSIMRLFQSHFKACINTAQHSIGGEP